MTNLLHRVSMRRKFAMVLTLPLLALIWFAFNGISERQGVVQELDRLQGMTEVARRAGMLIHQVQLERGMTAGFLGSEGKSFNTRLPNQRPMTDQAIAAFRQELDQLNREALTENAQERIDHTLRRLDATRNIRPQVDSLSIATNDVLAHYTGINNALMEVVGELSHLTNNGDVTRQLATYYSLLEAKDLAGIERALLSNAFAGDGMNEPMLRRFLSLLGAERAFLESFTVLASREQREQLVQALSGEQIERLERLRELAIAQAETGGYGVNPEQWFEWQTVKIGRLKALEDSVAGTIVATTQTLRSDARKALWLYVIIAVAASGIAILVATLIVHSITRPLIRALESIETRGNDLTRRLDVPGNDELSRLYLAFNDASAATEALVAELKQNAQSVEVASREIAQGNQDLAQRTEEQSASLVQTASSMEEITATVRQSTDNAHQAQAMTADVADSARQATDIAAKAQGAMHQIHEANGQVTKIIAAIDSIAFQTNMLALNASVEAARAGEHGRGFAVVAQEVRKLASRSAQEADEIRKLIDNNVACISEGETLVNSTSETLGTIARQAQQMAELVTEMSSATTEQSVGIEEINRAMTQLEQVTQQNAALVEQVAAASRSLDEQAEEVVGVISKYKVSDNTGRATARLPSA
ncbi:methyl-accepting chemotaxis protein [Vreelandella rituensis]|uniref:Methyl-accepting chemotaxis protein n=2 Tax=Vreelandella rituensis TaxID=2282306 RepID=A0A368U3K0_9GAMM|nr:methyl-accepting chemotaxis protein [Halomonas rituensis]